MRWISGGKKFQYYIPFVKNFLLLLSPWGSVVKFLWPLLYFWWISNEVPRFRLVEKKYSSVINYVVNEIALGVIDWLFFLERNRYLGFPGELVEVAYNFLLSFPHKHWIWVILLNCSNRVCVFKVSVVVESTCSWEQSLRSVSSGQGPLWACEGKYLKALLYLESYSI